MTKNISSQNNMDCNDTSYKLLMVDDSKTFNQKITDALRESGHEVVQSYSLEQTRQLIEVQKFDFVLLDLILPDGEGDQFLDTMPDDFKAKVIVLSADTDIQRRNHIFESGILDYFSKSNPTHLIIQDIKTLLCDIEKNKMINILVVDDSSFMRRMIRAMLSPKKYNIIEAADGIEALGILNYDDIHLMLCDLEMPNMDGAQLVEEVKSKVQFSELPIIMISSKDDKVTVSRVLKHGAKDFIKKPFSSEEMILKCDLHVRDHIKVEYIKEKEIEVQELYRRAKDAERSKSLFLANMSHEIRTPLNAIIGFVNLLIEDEKDDNKLKYLHTIENGSEHLLGLINDILDFSKIESNKLDIVHEVFTIYELVKSIVSMNEHKAEEKNISFVYDIANDVPKYLKSDFLRLKQILTNLIGNAIKFTPSNGEVKFQILLDKDKNNLLFSIQDSGIGIAPQNHDKVFELFSQAESTTTKKFGGTGLGLSISSKLVEMLGGKISLESDVGKGAKFYFNIPLKEYKKNEIKHKEEKRCDLVTRTKKFDNHILLVEDNKTNQTLMTIILKKLGLTFDIANDGVEAVRMYKQGNYDLVLMDENMPNMNGSEASEVIRKYEKESSLRYTPIIALTANAIKGDREKFLKAGMDEYLTKPLDKEKLIKFLSYFLGDEHKIKKEPKSEEKFDVYEKNYKIGLNNIDKLLDEKDDESILKIINLLRIGAVKLRFIDIVKITINFQKELSDKNYHECKNLLNKLNEIDIIKG
ncbi:MAG: response regulator [Campylobacterota bacterium]|nr:response regulator [Campylobacterota bacterium]